MSGWARESDEHFIAIDYPPGNAAICCAPSFAPSFGPAVPALAKSRDLSQLALERLAVDAEPARGLGDVPVAFHEHAMEMLPVEAIERHRVCEERARLGRASQLGALERKSDGPARGQKTISPTWRWRQRLNAVPTNVPTTLVVDTGRNGMPGVRSSPVSARR